MTNAATQIGRPGLGLAPGLHRLRMALAEPGFWDELGGATLKLAGVFWAGVILVDSIMWGLAGTNPLESLAGKIALNSAGALLTVFITAVLYRYRRASILQKVVMALAMSVVVSPFYAAVNALIYTTFCAKPGFDYNFQNFLYDTASSNGMFFGWSGLYISLLYSFEVRDRERKLAAVREEALAAQMRALQYQINPHFLFNTLNSIAGLVEEGAGQRAKRMVIGLSTFLRSTLELDPMADVPLSEELALQEDYLEIERERFADRMGFSIDVEPAVREALIPSMILQPLVENAIKHGVGRSAAPVDIRIIARKQADRLWLAVENGISPDRAPAKGFGIGLRNVAERLAARFGSAGRFSAGPVDAVLFRAEIELPWKVA